MILESFFIFAKKVDDVEFRNLQEQSYLNKIMENEKEFCRVLTIDEYSYTCSNFKPIFSTAIPDPKFPAYVVSYTYTAKFKDGTSEKYSTIKLQIPDHGNTWRIIVSEPEANMLNHPEEIASVLNSFTILDPVPPTCNVDEVLENGKCIPDARGGGCLIATATFDSELAPQVQQLRELRDNSLLLTESGTSFMSTFNDVYYSFSPVIADYERENPVFKEVVKLAITPMITSLSILNYVDMDSEAEVLGYGISLILLNIGMYVGIPASVIVGIRKKF